MTKMELKKPIPVYPIWILLLILIVINNNAQTSASWGIVAIVLTLAIMKYNTKKFRRYYYIKDEQRKARKIERFNKFKKWFRIAGVLVALSPIIIWLIIIIIQKY